MFSLAIGFDPSTGAFKVEGVPPDRIMALGMLELAKAEINRMAQEQVTSPIVRVPPGLRLAD